MRRLLPIFDGVRDVTVLSTGKVLTGTIEPGMELVNARTRKGRKKTVANKKKATK